MSNELATQDDGDGFGGSVTSSGNLNKGTLLKWTDSGGWIDRDGCTPPDNLLVLAIDTALQRWQGNKPTVMRDKPLPDPESLNVAIPKHEWEEGIDGKPRPPWAHVVVVYLVNPLTGEIYTYVSATTGAHIAHDQLREAVITMRALRGQRVMPVVNLSEKPMKSQFGMRKRPAFAIVGWKSPGGDDGGSAVPPPKPTPQIAGPTKAPATAAKPAAAQPYQPKPKPPINAGADTLNAMQDVSTPSTSEVMGGDEIPW